MAEQGLRSALRGALADLLRSAADRVAGQPAGPATRLEPEDVSFDAFMALQRHQVGWDFCFVDVRDPAEIAETGTLPDAVRIPGGELGRRWREVPTDVTVMVVSGRGERSVDAALTLRARGHDDAWSMAGGVAAWRREGGPLERP